VIRCSRCGREINASAIYYYGAAYCSTACLDAGQDQPHKPAPAGKQQKGAE